MEDRLLMDMIGVTWPMTNRQLTYKPNVTNARNLLHFKEVLTFLVLIAKTFIFFHKNT